MKHAKTIAALFDFDGTITRYDSMMTFILSLLSHSTNTWSQALRSLALCAPYALGLIKKEQLKSEIFQVYNCIPDAQRQLFLETFYQKRLQPMYYAQALDRIVWHKAQGHKLVLVSASADVYLEQVKNLLGFDHLIATRVELEPSPRVVGPNCYGPEKVTRLSQEPWYDQVDWPASWAYSDHISDLPMLIICGNPVATNPTKALRRHAQAQRWPVWEWK